MRQSSLDADLPAVRQCFHAALRCHKTRRLHRDKRFGVAWSSSGDTEFIRHSHYVAPTGYFATRFAPALLDSGSTSLMDAFRARDVFYSIFDDNDGKFRCFILSLPWTCRFLEPWTDQSFNIIYLRTYVTRHERALCWSFVYGGLILFLYY